MVNKNALDKILLGNKLCQFWTEAYFGDLLCLHHQGNDVTSPDDEEGGESQN
jgi:hypothetical protein